MNKPPPRTTQMLLGYLAACCAGGLAVPLQLSLIIIINALSSGADINWQELVLLCIALAPPFTLIACIISIIPAALIMRWGEARSERRAWVYAALGMIVAIIGAAIIMIAIGPTTITNIAGLAIAIMIPGIIAGIVYWAIAGRHAGR